MDSAEATHSLLDSILLSMGDTLSLYSLAVSSLTSPTGFAQVLSRKDLIPGTVLLDVFLKKAETASNTEDVQLLHEELCQVPTFLKLLSFKEVREGCVRRLWKLVIDGVIRKDEGIVLRGEVLPCRLASAFQKEMAMGCNQTKKLTDMGKTLGEFLYDMGWFKEAAIVLKICLENCLGGDDKQRCVLLARLLSAQVKYSLYDEAKAFRVHALLLIENLRLNNPNLAEIAELYSALSRLSTFESKYNESFELSMKALEAMRAFPDHYGIHYKATLEILCRGGVSCLNMLEFDKANILIKGALCLSKDVYGSKSTAYAEALHVYGKYFSDRDYLYQHQAVKTFEECLEIRSEAFGQFNLITAVTTKDLAHSYKSYGFDSEGCDSARQSVETLEILLPPSHLHITTINKLKGLIAQAEGFSSAYEMIAGRLRLLEVPFNKLTATFEEGNLEIGEYLGYLGGIYMTIGKFDDAEEVLLKGISILESASFRGSHKRVLALDLALLACLYRHQLKHEKAEPVLLRAIQTCVECFGESCYPLSYLYQEVLEILSELDPRRQEISDKREALLLEIQRQENAQNDVVEGDIENSSFNGVSTILESFFLGESVNDNNNN